jgi:hypothetical protein
MNKTPVEKSTISNWNDHHVREGARARQCHQGHSGSKSPSRSGYNSHQGHSGSKSPGRSGYNSHQGHSGSKNPNRSGSKSPNRSRSKSPCRTKSHTIRHHKAMAVVRNVHPSVKDETYNAYMERSGVIAASDNLARHKRNAANRNSWVNNSQRSPAQVTSPSSVVSSDDESDEPDENETALRKQLAEITSKKAAAKAAAKAAMKKDQTVALAAFKDTRDDARRIDSRKLALGSVYDDAKKVLVGQDKTGENKASASDDCGESKLFEKYQGDHRKKMMQSLANSMANLTDREVETFCFGLEQLAVKTRLTADIPTSEFNDNDSVVVVDKWLALDAGETAKCILGQKYTDTDGKKWYIDHITGLRLPDKYD